MKMTINPQNWIDDSVEISINESKKTVTVQGNVIKVRTNKQRLSAHNVMELCEIYFEDSQIASGYKDDGYWYLDDGYDLSRQDSNLYVAAAQMASNLI